MSRGKLILIVGPMFAGKTTFLIKKVLTLEKEKILVIKPRLDNRYSKKEIVTHDHQRLIARVVDERNPQAIKELYSPKYDYLFVDEVNFFSFSVLWSQLDFFLERGVNVYAAGLEYDYRQKVFGPIHKLRQYADRVIQLYAVCDGCGGRASLSYRKEPQKGQVVVGGKELYGACCLQCYPKLSH